MSTQRFVTEVEIKGRDFNKREAAIKALKELYHQG